MAAATAAYHDQHHDDDDEDDDRSSSTVVNQEQQQVVMIAPSLDHHHSHHSHHSHHPSNTNHHGGCQEKRDDNKEDEIETMFVTDGCHFDAQIRDDPSAFHLCHSLQKNKTLKQMELTVWASQAVSQRGMNALAKGIQASNIESLAIRFGMRFDFGRQLPKDLIQCVYPKEVVQHLRQLHLHYELDNADVKSLNLAFSNNTSLEQVSLSIRGVDEKHAAQELFSALQQGTNISTLALRGARPRVYKILFERGLLALGALRHLCIDNANFNFGPEDDDHENDHENENDQTEHHHRHHHNHRYDDRHHRHQVRGGIVLQQPLLVHKTAISNVETLVLENCPLKIKDEWMQQWLIQSATNMPQLRELTLKDHELDVAGLECLIQALAKHTRLQTFHLSLDDSENGALTRQQMDGLFYDGSKFPLPSTQLSCATMLVNQFRCGVVLRCHVHLYCRRVQPEGLQQLVQATSHYACIKSIELRDNGIGMDGLVRMAQALPFSKLSKFKVCFFLPYVDDPQQAVAQQVGREAAAKAFCHAVQSNMYLQELVVQDENILRSHKQEIDFYLTLNKYGRQLFMNHHPPHPHALGDDEHSSQQVPAGLWAHVLAKHRHYADVFCYLLREQPLLVPQSPPPHNITTTTSTFSEDDNTIWSEYNQPMEDIS